MSAVLRDRRYGRVGSYAKDWVVLHRNGSNVTISSVSAGVASLTVPEADLVVVDDGTQLSLDPGADARLVSPSAAEGISPPTSAATSFASPDAWPVQSTSPGLHRQPLPVARATDPDTAHLAAATARGAAAANRLKVLLAHRDAGERGLTGWELEQATQTPYETLGPRRPSLETDGLIVATNERRPNGRGNLERVYAITEAGRITADRAVA